MSVSKSSESGTANFTRSRNGSGYSIGSGAGPISNFFGYGTDGATTIASNTSLTVQNKNGSYDGDMVVKHYESLTINSGVTLTTDQPCRGLLIYVQGDCTINGTLSMTQRGAAANPTVSGASDGGIVSGEGLKFPFATSTGTDILTSDSSLLSGCGNLAKAAIANHPSLSGDGTVVVIQRIGAAGGSRPSGGTPISPNAGSNGTAGQSGGGGSGGGYYSYSSAGAGGQGTCFSGGTGGGGAHGGTAANGADYGGAGGNGATPDNGYPVPGGIGNPNGTWSTGGYTANSIDNSVGGTGGLLILIVGGTLTIGAGGAIRANGFAGPTFSGANRAGGGASGGGNVVVAYRAISNSGSITATGGTRWGWGDQTGGAGGNGSVQLLEVI